MTAAIEQYVMTEAEAHRVTEDIRHNAKSFTEYRARMMQAVERAKAGSAHVALGYPSWTAYLSEVLGEEPMRLARAERQDMVRMLSDEGMSTRAIAPIVGASQRTVADDVSKIAHLDSTSPAPEFVDTRTGEIHDEPAPKPVAVTGMDGKQYTRPIPPETPTPRPDPITTQFTSAIADLNRVLDKLHRIHTSDNFNTNKEKINDRHKADLTRAIEELDQLRSHLSS